MQNERQFLYSVAGHINNRLSAPIDIVTICGLLSVDEIKAHLKHYFAQLNADQKQDVLAFMRAAA